MRAVNAREYLTEREIEEFKQEMQVAEKQAEVGIEFKKLELEIKKIETKWTQIWRIPLAVIVLPVKFIMAFGIIASLITKKDLPKEFWDFLRS